MKILAIRGENLASLEGAFELNLAEGPLAEAGVFAICGPTGAGKSTLLDAMCLALFDTAPRLEGRGRGRVGRASEEDHWLTVQDPRTLLRKGAGHGFAEVDFEGVDGGRYRARWEARRSRGRSDGKLQPSKMSIRNLDDDWNEGGRKTDVRTEIEARLGLTFDQFRRSVLLAQGDFAAFLEADARDRADLLERMTGTEIYGLISMETHARLGEERRRVERIAARLEELRVLARDERSELDAERVELTQRVRHDELAVSDAARAVRWHAQRQALFEEEQEAREREQQLANQLSLVETERGRLSALEAALPLWPALDELNRASAQLAELEASHGRAEQAGAKAREQMVRAQQARTEAERAREAIEAEREQSRPILEQARALDAALEDLNRRAEQEAEHAAALDVRYEEAKRASEAAAAVVSEVDARLASARAWLTQHPRAERAEQEWSRVEEHLGHRVELAARLAALKTEVQAARQAAEQLAIEHAEAEGRALGLRHARSEAEGAFVVARDAARAAPSSELAEVRERWSAQRTALETLLGVADRAQSALKAEERQRTLAGECESRARVADREAQAADEAVKEAEGRSAEAQRQRDGLRARLDLSAHRAELVDGEPCPLCGSPAHPFAAEAPVVSELLHAADARLHELNQARLAAERDSADKRRTAEAERESGARASVEADRWAEELADARDRYRRTAAELTELRGPDAPLLGAPVQLPMAPTDAETPDWGPLFQMTVVSSPSGSLLDEEGRRALEQARVEAEERLAGLDRTSRERREAERRAERLRLTFEALRDAHGEANSVRSACGAALERARADRTLVERDQARLVERMRRSSDALDEVLEPYGGWQKRPPSELLEEVRREVHARRQRLAAQTEAARQRATCAPEATRLEALLSSEEERRRVVRARQQELAREMADKHAARASRIAALEARLEACACRIDALDEAATEVESRARNPVDVAETRFVTAIERAKAAAARAHAELTAVTRADAEQTAESARVSGALAETRLRHARLHSKLSEALADTEHDEASLRRLLEHDADEIARWRDELARLDAARKEQHAVVLERARRRQTHEEDEAPKVSGEHAEAEHARAYDRLEKTRELLHAVRTRLERDDTNRAARRTARAEHEVAREQLGVWETLQSLIGSASGNKLRVFAQSLTLELLLEHANHHLQDLAPRYGLARVPGEDLALQVVDYEMGEEVRAVSSLSGGESFLVALGLALGLASLTSQRSRVDSLFIDEGFGALDPASLELVLGTLDTLQASGRQVGLISHVPAIADRFSTRVQVVPAGPARSRIELVQ